MITGFKSIFTVSTAEFSAGCQARELSRNGVYAVRNIVNGKSYIGSTSSRKGFRARFSHHVTCLRKGNYGCTKLQRAWDKYGSDAFEFCILEFCEKSECLNKEQFYIETTQAVRCGYNICHRANSRLGAKHSDETKARIGAGNRGKKRSLEVRALMSRRQMGRTPWNSGIPATTDSKLAHSETMRLHWRTHKHPSSRPVRLLADDRVFEFSDARAACKADMSFDYPLNFRHISQCCHRKLKHHGKMNGVRLRWEFQH